MLEYNEDVVEDMVYELELECYDSEINLPNLKFVISN